MTLRDLLRMSALDLGVIAAGEVLPAIELTDIISKLNTMLDSWSTDGLIVPYVTREEFTFIPNQAAVTVGPDTVPLPSDFDTERPTRIIAAAVKENGTEMPIDIITVEQWSDISNKSTTSTLPLKVYPEGTSPLETLNFWPVPSTANTFVLYSEKAFSNFTYSQLSTSLTFAPGYLEPIQANLSVRIAPMFGKMVSPDLANLANESLANLKRKNTKPVYLVSDVAGLMDYDTFNIIKGE